MPVAEILAGIALVKSSVDFIKSNIQTAQDIGEIAGAIDGLFKGTEEVQKKRNKRTTLYVIPLISATRGFTKAYTALNIDYLNLLHETQSKATKIR